MKIYLAGRYSRRDELRQVATQLEKLGHTITSRWLETEWEITEIGSSAAPPEKRQEFALKDMEDVREADLVISFTEEPRSGGRGGRHVEFGMAAAWGKAMIIVGPEEHIFHHLPGVVRVTSVAELETGLRKAGY